MAAGLKLWTTSSQRQSHSSASCRRWSGEGARPAFACTETGGTAAGLNLGFWRGRLKAVSLSLSKPCPGRVYVVGRQEALCKKQRAETLSIPLHIAFATSYRSDFLRRENVWKLRFVHLSCLWCTEEHISGRDKAFQLLKRQQAATLNQIANRKPRRIHVQKYTPRPITTLSNQIFAPSRTQTIIWKTVYCVGHGPCGSVCIGPYGDEYQCSANLYEPDKKELAREIGSKWRSKYPF